MATVNPYEAPQSVELATPLKLPLPHQQQCQIIATGFRLIYCGLIGGLITLMMTVVAMFTFESYAR